MELYKESQKKDHCGVAPLKVDDVVINDNLTKAETLNNYFTSVFTPVASQVLPEIHEEMKPDINPILVETNGVLELLQSLNVHKACGPDEIPARLLKEACKEIVQQCTVPLDWKRANIVPLFKKGDRSTLVITDLFHLPASV